MCFTPVTCFSLSLDNKTIIRIFGYIDQNGPRLKLHNGGKATSQYIPLTLFNQGEVIFKDLSE